MKKNLLQISLFLILIERCKQYIIDKKQQVFIVIDSGTTLYYFMEKLSTELAKYKRDSTDNADWINKISIISNNLPGIQIAIDKGALYPKNRFSPPTFECIVLPGTAMSLYAAITGKETDSKLQSLRKINKDNLFIGLTVGNWIRIRNTMPACPLPMARGEGHLSFKQVLTDNCDEIYILSPLGKIFIKKDLKTINSALFPQYQKDKEIGYEELVINNNEAEKVKLVSTVRTDENKILFMHSGRLKDALDCVDNKCELDINTFSNTDIKTLPHILFEYDRNYEYPYSEEIAELPHLQTRDKKFKEEFFSIPQKKNLNMF